MLPAGLLFGLSFRRAGQKQICTISRSVVQQAHYQGQTDKLLVPRGKAGYAGNRASI
jgi:hypothetical protein